jgi:predicted amidophosphoribosyltransferase
MTELRALTAFPDCHDCASFQRGAPADCLACASAQISKPGPSACPVCAQRIAADGRCPNELCRSSRRHISRIRAIGYQTGPLRRAIHSYKYGGARSWAVVLGRLLLAWLEQNMAAGPPDLIVANPSLTTAAVLGAQPFGHTEAVLQAAAEADTAHHWPFDTVTPAAIIKTRPTLKSADAQAWSKRVTATELRNALAVPDPGRTAGRFILVYDDVATTGGQLDAVAGCLLDQGGAARVEGIVLARAPWRGR